MKQRGVNRRSHRRFEIVGTFLGSLETWHSLTVRDIGPAGAMVETAETFPRDWKLRARVTYGSRYRDMRVDVRHAATGTTDGGGYVLGIEFPEQLADLGDVAGERMASVEAPGGRERRRYSRIKSPHGVDIGFAKWTTVELADLSLGGAMLITAARFDVGRRGFFRARFGGQSFEAEIESRRIAPRVGPNPRYGIGASFVSMGEESRQSLASFLVAAES